MYIMINHVVHSKNLAKLDDGLAESPTVMVGETKNNTKKWVKIGAYENPVGLSSRPLNVTQR